MATKITTAAMRAALTDLIEVLELTDEQGNTLEVSEDTSEDDLKAQILEALPYLEDENRDELSEKTLAVIDALNPKKGKEKAAPAGKKATKKEPEPEPEPEDDEEDNGGEAEDEDGIDVNGDLDDLQEDIEAAEDKKELAEIAENNDMFAPVVKKIKTFKTADALRKAMLVVVEAAKDAAEEPAVEDKKSAKKEPEKPAAKKETEKASKKEPEKPAAKKETAKPEKKDGKTAPAADKKSSKPAAKKEKAPKEKKEKVPSAYGTAIEVMCTNPELSLEDLRKAVTKKGINVEENRSAVLTGYSSVRKIVSLLKENGFVKK